MIKVIKNWKIMEFCEKKIPFIMPILGRVKSPEFQTVINNEKAIGCLGDYRELFLHIYDSQDIEEVLSNITEKMNNIRIILFSENDIDNTNIIDEYVISTEIFFIWEEQNLKSNNYDYGYFAREENINELIELEKSYIDEEIGWMKSERKLELRQFYERKIQKHYVYINGEDISCKIEIKSQYANYEEIGGIFTKKSMRGKGIATKCLSGFLRCASEKGLKIVLNTRINNLQANKLYKSLGFVPIGNVYYMTKRES